MSEYISTFITGFGDIVSRRIISDLPNSKVIGIYDGLVHYSYNGDFKDIIRLIYLNNTFFVLQKFIGKDISFESMIYQTSKKKHSYKIDNVTCRVRFSNKNQFVGVEKSELLTAERHILKNSHLRIDRVNPKTEVWFLKRSEGISFYCQLLHKRVNTEKKLNKGELRPELAYLLCCCADLTKGSTVCDPFTGYGSIPKQIVNGFDVKIIYAFDNNEVLVKELRKQKWVNDRVVLKTLDSTCIDFLGNETVDSVITDPPWGLFESIEDIESFYKSALREILRIVKPGGSIVILTAQKEIVEKCFWQNKILNYKKINTLVNGKKSAVYIARKK